MHGSDTVSKKATDEERIQWHPLLLWNLAMNWMKLTELFSKIRKTLEKLGSKKMFFTH